MVNFFPCRWAKPTVDGFPFPLTTGTLSEVNEKCREVQWARTRVMRGGALMRR